MMEFKELMEVAQSIVVDIIEKEPVNVFVLLQSIAGSSVFIATATGADILDVTDDLNDFAMEYQKHVKESR